MAEYDVNWGITLDADSPREAAEKAAVMQADPGSCAHCYDVRDIDAARAATVTIDLDEPEPIPFGDASNAELAMMLEDHADGADDALGQILTAAAARLRD